MPLSPGDRLGPYEILAPIGAGGMGEVYRARDSKLHRDVAIKVLPTALANDAQYMARFEREAQMLAALNHPNIATVYGIEQGALVMELVDGSDLRGPLPVEEAIPIARQIAEGLEAAHERGITHRDLKPANIKLTPAGVVKILDFGLAKTTGEFSAAPPGASPTMSPTLSLAMTQAGMILGTAAYMSPEQARGKPVDKRTDIWAFGAVLYEMLTGKMAFAGDSVTDILASVVKLEPDWSALPPSTPPNVRALLRRCLTKDWKQRLQAIGEARIVLEQPGSEATAAPRAAGSYRAVAAVALLAAAGAGAVAWRASRPVSQPLARWMVQPGPEFVAAGDAAAAILSPDGTRLVYTGAGPDGRLRLYTRLLEQEQTSALAGTEGARDPFFSPGGEAVGFFAGGKLRKVYMRGEGAVVLCNAPLPQGGSWGEDGNIVAALASSGVLSRISSGGGAPQPLTTLRQELTHRWPQVLPGARAVLFTAHTAGLAFDDATVEVQSLRTGERKTLVRGGTFGR
jgi:Protein kinase domain